MDSLFCEEHRAISRLVPKDPIIQAEKWWFKLKPQEREQLEKVRGKEATEKVWQEIKDRRSFWGHLLFIAFCVLVFFGWDNFWAWYEKPLTDEWGWPEDDEEEEDDEDEKEIKKQADTKEKKEPVEETPTPKTRWGKIKNWLLNNKTRTVLLLALIPSLLALVVRVVKLL
jgi:hypothetical protein